MVEAFIRERGVTPCPPRIADWSYRATANGHGKGGHFLYQESTAPKSPEQKLAAAKILQMLQDLGMANRGGGLSERQVYRAQAEHWFFNTQDFVLWCDTAGLDPQMIRQKAREVLVHGFSAPMSEKQRARNEQARAYNARRKLRNLQ